MESFESFLCSVIRPYRRPHSKTYLQKGYFHRRRKKLYHFDKSWFLAHLAQSAKVRYCGGADSSIRRAFELTLFQEILPVAK